MSDLASLLAGLDAGQRVRGRGFERLCRWVLENAPEYAATVDKVWLWDEWPGREGRREQGIDLVARDRDGGLWAVQAKHYDPAYAIKKSDLDSFLSESSRAEFTYRLLIATTDHLGPNARSTLAIQEKAVGTVLRSQLELLYVEWPADLSDLRPARPEPKLPRPHQLRAIDECVSGLEIADRGQLVMACGTGKTLVGSFLAARLEAKRVLVLVPSLSLLGQTLREWATAVTFDYLAVCSDETVTKDEQDAVVASTSELGIPVTTDSERIASFLRRRSAETSVVFATYQSSPQIAAAQSDQVVPVFDLVISDEAHRCAGPQAGVFATVLDATKIKAHKRLFMTATPRYYTGRVKREANEADWEVASMDEEAKFGSVLHRLSFAQAIDQDLLSDYQVVVVGVSDDEAQDLAARGAFVTADATTITDARTLARQIGLLRTMAKYDLHRVVSFHSRIDHASRFAASLPETNEWLPADRRLTGSLWTDHVSGKMTAGERDARLRRLKGVVGNERGVLTNARCLGEGVDVPTLDGVAFIDPRRSQVDVVQAVGRAIRKAEDKTLGTIVIPVLIEEEGDPEEALAAKEFDRVWEIVRSMRDHDGDLAEELDELRRGLGSRGSLGARPRKIVLDLPVHIGDAFARAFDARVVETSTPRWEFWYGLLQRYVTREGHTLVPVAHDEEGYRLGEWVIRQRRSRRANRLPANRVTLLEALRGWTWDALDAAWDEGFMHLERFIAREGNARVPVRHEEGDFALGTWVGRQRTFFRTGRLPAERIARLDAVPGWRWDPLDVAWEEGFEHLHRFVSREGNARVPARHSEGDFALGRWLNTQRIAFRARRLPAERIARLEGLHGWTWDPLDAAWDEGFMHLERFVAREGNARVPGEHRELHFTLGRWVTSQREAYRAGRLPAQRIALLEDIPGWTWHATNTAWEKGFLHLERFVGRESHSRVPHHHREDGYPLGRWVGRQRMFFRTGRLSDERIARLQALPGWTWGAFDLAWEEHFSDLERFVAREGHTRVPWEHVEEGFELGKWVGRQRTDYQARARRLSAERSARLEALPGWTWSAPDVGWSTAFSYLEQFVAREGHARVPSGHIEDGYGLAQWVQNQRRFYRTGTLPAERIASLEALSGWTWEPHQADWERGFASLVRFVEREGHARVPQTHFEDDYGLGRWVSKQRVAYRARTLAPDRIARLEPLPGWKWEPHDIGWDTGFAALCRFVEREGHARVPRDHVEDSVRLGLWVVNKRRRRERLAADRIARLEALPGWTWDARRTT